MNAIVFVLDTQRRDHLSCYGYPRTTSPNLDALAAEGVVFENCVTNTAHTMPTFTTMVTGQDPGAHGIVGTLFSHPDEPDQRLSDRVPVLAEVLRSAGLRTAAFDNLIDFGCHPVWFVRGYQFVANIWAPQAGHPSQVIAQDINDHLTPWLSWYADGEPFFAFVHYWDPHQAYNQPEPFRAIHTGEPAPRSVEIGGREYIPGWGWSHRLDQASLDKIDLYNGELSYVDDAIGNVVALLRKLGRYDETAIIVTADHGEDMQEHDAPFEHREPYECTAGIPLILKPPAGSGIEPGLRVPGIVGNCDLMPSLLDLLGIETPGSVEGRSWLPLARQETERLHDALFITGGAIKERGTWKCPENAVRTERYKYIRRGTAGYHPEQTHLDIACLCAPPWRGEGGFTLRDKVEYFNSLPRRELYDLAADPWEQTNIADREPGVVAEMDARLREFTARHPERFPLD